MPSANWWPFCLGLIVLKYDFHDINYAIISVAQHTPAMKY